MVDNGQSQTSDGFEVQYLLTHMVLEILWKVFPRGKDLCGEGHATGGGRAMLMARTCQRLHRSPGSRAQVSLMQGKEPRVGTLVLIVLSVWGIVGRLMKASNNQCQQRSVYADTVLS
ncbi:hypothetical protein UY3_05317 [Chelonia mydas]|uniref:Uncharacterized protein n=1 Tax=Chelonia mydas TaxID=8469 RepID=M7BJX9_CHEMY|nr:hypothetical protein UY3_05317 [Chelonia mydas]